MSDPKDAFAPGQMTDGSITVMTPEEAVRSIADRDAEEEAFGVLLDDDEFRAAYEAAEGEDEEE
jgi:hypothetical protein